jgi:hypothetical protein
MPITLDVTPQALRERLASIGRILAARDDALALLALGSLGRADDVVDAWSDLDFFVFVRDGAKARYIESLDWLTAAHPLIWSYQNTVDGHKALMSDGIFCEFAVFELGELSHIPYSPGRFVWRRENVSESLAYPTQPLPGSHNAQWLANEALSNLIIGLLRYARGEKLSAMRLVQVHALDRVLELVEAKQPCSNDATALRDPFSVDRRVELRMPQIAKELPTWAGGYHGTHQSALSLLDALEANAEIPAQVADYIRSLAGLED